MSAETITQGRRVHIEPDNRDFMPRSVQRGDYWKDDETGIWWACLPCGGVGNLADHQIVEHEDGAITVSPSILLPDRWHGYLEHGIWREI